MANAIATMAAMTMSTAVGFIFIFIAARAVTAFLALQLQP
jgi:hypothetical protein